MIKHWFGPGVPFRPACQRMAHLKPWLLCPLIELAALCWEGRGKECMETAHSIPFQSKRRSAFIMDAKGEGAIKLYFGGGMGVETGQLTN